MTRSTPTKRRKKRRLVALTARKPIQVPTVNSLLKTLSVTLAASALVGLSFVRTSDAQQPAPAPAPAPASSQYTQIDVNYRGPVDEKMYFSDDPPATLTAAITLCEPPMSFVVTIEVEAGGDAITRGEATEALADAIRDAMPPSDTEVTVAGSTIIVEPTCASDALGTGDEPIHHPNDGKKVNENRPGTSQFSGN